MLTSLFFPFTSLHGECYRFLITPAEDERNIILPTIWNKTGQF